MNEMLRFIDKLTIEHQDSYLAYSETEPHNNCFFMEDGVRRSESSPRVYVRTIGNWDRVISRETVLRLKKHYGYMAGEISSMRICLCDQPHLRSSKRSIESGLKTVRIPKQTRLNGTKTEAIQKGTIGQGKARP